MKKYIFGVPLLAIWLWMSFHILRNMYWYNMNPVEAAFISIGDETNWAPSFSEKSFESIYIGEKQDEVLKKLGPPMDIVYVNKDGIYFLKGEVFWHYTVGKNGKAGSAAGGNVHVRAIVFDKNLKVKKTIRYFLD